MRDFVRRAARRIGRGNLGDVGNFGPAGGRARAGQAPRAGRGQQSMAAYATRGTQGRGIGRGAGTI